MACLTLTAKLTSLTLSRPLLTYGYSYKESCARPGWAFICNFWHPGTLTLSPERQSARMSKNYKWRLNPVWHRMLYSCTRMSTVGVKGLKYNKLCRCVDIPWRGVRQAWQCASEAVAAAGLAAWSSDAVALDAVRCDDEGRRATSVRRGLSLVTRPSPSWHRRDSRYPHQYAPGCRPACRSDRSQTESACSVSQIKQPLTDNSHYAQRYSKHFDHDSWLLWTRGPTPLGCGQGDMTPKPTPGSKNVIVVNMW